MQGFFIRRISLCLVLASMFPSVVGAEGNLIVNGSFEEGDYSRNNGSWQNVCSLSISCGPATAITGWSVDGIVNWHNGAQFIPIQDGSRAVDLSNNGICFDGRTGALSQTITTATATTYLLSFYVSAPSNSSGCSGPSYRRLRVIVDGTSMDFTTAASPNTNISWYHHQITFTPTSSETTITFAIPSDEVNGFWGSVIDNVRVIAFDSDGDGIPDSTDACSATATGNVIDSTGCSIFDYCPCSGPQSTTWKNHGAYVACITHRAREFVNASLISRDAAAEMVVDAAHSNCGK